MRVHLRYEGAPGGAHEHNPEVNPAGAHKDNPEGNSADNSECPGIFISILSKIFPFEQNLDTFYSPSGEILK